MVDKSTLESIVQRLNEHIPPGLKAFQKELESLFRGVLSSTLAKLDLVTKEEFDVQVKVLQKTRKKLDELTQKIDALEGRSTKRSE